MYKIGDFVVYKRSICKIKDIYKRNGEDYYALCPMDDDSLKIDVSVDKSKEFVMPIISKEELLKIIDNIPNVKVLSGLPEKKYEQEYKRLILTGDHNDLIQIIKTTYLRNQHRLDEKKKIGEKDNNYFNLAEKKLYNEFSIALNMTFDETKEFVHQKVLENDK